MVKKQNSQMNSFQVRPSSKRQHSFGAATKMVVMDNQLDKYHTQDNRKTQQIAKISSNDV
jgi:hypothetical protein